MRGANSLPLTVANVEVSPALALEVALKKPDPETLELLVQTPEEQLDELDDDAEEDEPNAEELEPNE